MSVGSPRLCSNFRYRPVAWAASCPATGIILSVLVAAHDASCFIGAVLILSFASRLSRSTELRFEGFAFTDPTSRFLWDSLKHLEFPVLVPHRPDRVDDHRMAALPHHREQHLFFLGNVVFQIVTQRDQRLGQAKRGLVMVAVDGFHLLRQGDQPIHLGAVGRMIPGQDMLDQRQRFLGRGAGRPESAGDALGSRRAGAAKDGLATREAKTQTARGREDRGDAQAGQRPNGEVSQATVVG